MEELNCESPEESRSRAHDSRKTKAQTKDGKNDTDQVSLY